MSPKNKLKRRGGCFSETKAIRRLPQEFNSGGYLESKNGVLCLRMADSLWLNKDRRTYTVVRTWMRPGKAGFDKDMYTKRKARK